MNKDTGGPAFPTFGWDEKDRAYKMHGMTLRDYFAAKAMQGIVSDPDLVMGMEKVAEWAYQQADAMLKAKEQNESTN